MSRGVLGMRERPEPVTAAEAAQRLRVPVGRVYVWVNRYNARKTRLGKTAWYDWHDLKTIARQLHVGEPVPKTPQERDEIRARFARAA